MRRSSGKSAVLGALLLVALLAPGCGSRPSPEPAAPQGERTAPQVDVPVYVDGRPAAVLRYGELPELPNVGTERAPSFPLDAYLEGIGIPPAKVKLVYFYDASGVVGSVTGAELVNQAGRFLFHFASGRSGRPELGWTGAGLANERIVHDLRRVVVFVGKPAPGIDRELGCIVEAGGCSSSVPYVNRELGKGTRVYVDSELQGSIKRRTLVAPHERETKEQAVRRRLSAVLVHLGIGFDDIAAVELVSGDEVVARAKGVEWASKGPGVDVILEPHMHGRLRVEAPGSWRARGSSELAPLVTSILVFRDKPHRSRPVVPVSEATERAARLGAEGSKSEKE